MHVYPHPELPLIPRLLLPTLERQSLEIGGNSFTAEQLADADFCRSLAPNSRTALANMISAIVQKVCYGRVKKKPWTDARIDVAPGCRLTDLALTDRALVSLQRSEFFTNDGPWRNASIDDIVGPRGQHHIGARLMLALLLAAQAAKRPAADQSQTLESAPVALEAELQSLVQRVIHSRRTAKIYLDMNGWGGRGEQSLGAIAQELGITHERARQIGGTGALSMACCPQAFGELPLLANALACIGDIAPCTASCADAVIKIKLLSAGEFKANAVLTAAERFGASSPLKMYCLDGQDFVARPEDARLLSEIRLLARRALRTHGILNLSVLKGQCLEAFDRAGSEVGNDERDHVFRLALTTIPGWSFLDPECNWATVSLGTDGESLQPRGPVARVARLAVYFGGIKLSTAQKVLQLHGVTWPAKIVLALCLRVGLMVAPLHNDWAIEVPADLKNKLERALQSTTEFEMTEILKREGGALSRSSFLLKCERAGIHRSTFLACLKTSSLFFQGIDGEFRLSVEAALESLSTVKVPE